MSTPTVPPIFLFGHDRSGTTLLSMMVGAHSRIAVPFSCTGMWYRYGDRLGDYGDLETLGDVERLVDDLLAEERIGLWDEELDRDALLEGLPTGDYPAIVRRFHEAYAGAKSKDLWANIDIATLDEMDSANAWFPDARFIHIVRDGRDVALSHQTMPYNAGNIAECAEEWRQKLHTGFKMGGILGSDRFMVVRYEDLVLDSERTLRAMCAFMGVEFCPRMEEYHRMVETKIPDEKRWMWPALNKPPVASKVGRWKREMGPARRIVFENIGNRMLRDLGYEAFDKVPSTLGAHWLDLWYFLDRGRRFRRLARKFGLARRSKLERDWDRRAGKRNKA